MTVEVIAQQGDAMGGHLRGMGVKPAFARGALTVLFVMPVLRHDVLRGQGNDLGLAWADDHRSDGGMIREGVAITELTSETVVAMNGCGRTGAGPIEGHQQLVAKDPKGGRHTMLFKALKDLNKDRIEMAWRHRIEQRTDLLVTGNLRYTSQGLGILVPFGVIKMSLRASKPKGCVMTLSLVLWRASP